MRSTLITSLGFLASVAQADFGVWRIQESVVEAGTFVYPLMSDGTVQTGADVYNWWAARAHWYDLECDGCGYGDATDQTGGAFFVGDTYDGSGTTLRFDWVEDGAAKDACSQLLGLKCDYRITRNGNEDVGGCEFGGHALTFTENTMGVLAHIDGFRHLWCKSEQVSFT